MIHHLWASYKFAQYSDPLYSYNFLYPLLFSSILLNVRADLYQALTWPPPDPSYIPSRPRKAIEPKTTRSSNGFIYGRDMLNPALQPTSSRFRPGLDTNQARARNSSLVSTRVDDGWSDEEQTEEQRWEEEDAENNDDNDDDDDNIPLGLKIRRGSEGYEVRPRTYGSTGTDWDLGRDDLVRRYEARRA